ncbi:hypothetical protein AX17_006784 [Amanita inopinata Kibby_2008]|nr:hypothetical protein AX17_006784 [Amanita inopinata Kibby_2008]
MAAVFNKPQLIMMLSPEVQHLIVEWRLVHWKSHEEIALIAHCSVWTVYNVLNYCLGYISGLIDACPKIYLDEIQEELAINCGVIVSLASVSWALHCQALSHKNVLHAALEKNEELQLAWIAEHGDIPKEYFIWVDESSVDDCTNQ